MGSEESVRVEKLDVGEMRILRRICGVTKLDRIRNQIIRRTIDRWSLITGRTNMQL